MSRSFFVKVVPGSSRAGVSHMSDETLKINVTSPPEKGKANEEVRQLLAGHFGVPLADVEIVSGQGSPRKLIRLR